MSLSRDTRAEKKLKALRRAEFGLRQRFERIDWEEDELYPEVAELKAGRPILGLPSGTYNFDIEIAEETADVEDQAKASDTSRA